MCGRFTLSSPADVVAELFELAEVPELRPRYNIAPTQSVVAVTSSLDGERTLSLFQWGLIPSWARDPSIGSRLINARAETVATKPSFRSAIKCRRCLIVADGFYEWKKHERHKQPYYIRMRNGTPFAFAGLWERWQGATGDAVDSCTIITTEPNSLLADLHHRMPVILDRADYGAWLDPNRGADQQILALLRPCPDEPMEAYPVTTHVNRPANDDRSCIEARLGSGDAPS